MDTVALQSEWMAEPRATCPGVSLHRQAFYLASQGETLFAWLHRKTPPSFSGHGVLICPPLGHEHLHSQRTLRHLADALAGAGFLVLRFDYRGTGDSAGNNDGDQLAAWHDNVRDALDWLRDKAHCQEVTLFGLRFGATLAGLVASSQAVDNLVLWAPILSGRRYARELKALGMVGHSAESEGAAPSGPLEAGGFVYPKQTIDDLARINLLEADPRCRRVLVLHRDGVGEEARVADHLKTLGVDVEQRPLSGYADMLAEPHLTRVPWQAITDTTRWLKENRSALRPRPVANHTLPGIPSLHSLGGVDLAGHARPIRERILHCSGEAELFGILTTPETGLPDSLPLILLLNAGSASRIGPNRLYVDLARQLAAQGFGCLRLDLGGLGDSIGADPGNENDPYPDTAFRDIDQALKHLQHHFGVRQFILAGLCSGAYAAFQSAVQLRHPAIVESVLINPLTFYWKKGMTIGAMPAHPMEQLGYYRNILFKPGKWLKLLSGRSRTGLAGAARMLLAYVRTRLFAKRNELRDCQADPTAALGHPQRQDLPADLDRIVGAGRHLTFVFSEEDPGYHILMLQARRKVKRLRRQGTIDIFHIGNADHTFSRLSARQSVGRAITLHLVQRYQNPVALPGRDGRELAGRIG